MRVRDRVPSGSVLGRLAVLTLGRSLHPGSCSLVWDRPWPGQGQGGGGAAHQAPNATRRPRALRTCRWWPQDAEVAWGRVRVRGCGSGQQGLREPHLRIQVGEGQDGGGNPAHLCLKLPPTDSDSDSDSDWTRLWEKGSQSSLGRLRRKAEGAGGRVSPPSVTHSTCESSSCGSSKGRGGAWETPGAAASGRQPGPCPSLQLRPPPRPRPSGKCLRSQGVHEAGCAGVSRRPSPVPSFEGLIRQSPGAWTLSPPLPTGGRHGAGGGGGFGRRGLRERPCRAHDSLPAPEATEP